MPKLSDALVGALTCPAGKKDVLFFDGVLPGFGVRVTSTGKRIFLLQYRMPDGVRRLVLGTFGTELTTHQARAKAQIRLGEVRDGRDPHAELHAKRAAAVVAKGTAKQAAAEAVFTLARLVEEWDARHLAGMRPSYRRDAVGRLRLHLAGLLERPAAEVTKAQAVRELDRIAKAAGDTTARRVMGYARSAYGWTLKRGAIAVNPFEGLPLSGRQEARDRVLTADEVRAVWRAAAELPPVHGAFARFLLLTLARRQEVASMRWSEVAADLSTWTLPAGRAKNRRAHLVHLAPAARAILEGVPRLDGDGLVFAAGPRKALTTFSFIKRQLDAAIAAEEAGRALGEGRKAKAMAGWTLHDFRRAGVTALAGMGVAPHVCDRLLNHVTGAIQGVAAVYQRAEFLAERRAALEAWGKWVVCDGS